MEDFDYFDELLAADADSFPIFDDEDAHIEPEISSRALKRRLKQNLKKLGQRDELRDLIKELPAPGEQIHIVSKGKFNFWTFCPVISELLGRPIEKLYCGTWVVNVQGVKECLQMIDAGLVKKCYWLVGKYLKNREPSVFYQLTDGIRKRDAGYVKAIETHAKLMLIEAPPFYLSLTGSANMSENKRVEDTQVTNDLDVYQFYQLLFDESKGAQW